MVQNIFKSISMYISQYNKQILNKISFNDRVSNPIIFYANIFLLIFTVYRFMKTNLIVQIRRKLTVNPVN